MKKLILLAIAALSFIGSAATKTASELWKEADATPGPGRSAWYDRLSESELKVLADDILVIAATNLTAAQRMKTPVAFRIFCHWEQHPVAGAGLAGEYDGKFAAAGLTHATVFWKYAPKMTEAYINSPKNAEWARKFPAYVAMIRSISKKGESNTDLAVGANIMVECAANYNPNHNYGAGLEAVKNRIARNATKLIRRKLRSQGLPITVKDGVNPVQNDLDRLVQALNAPKMAGLKEWFAEFRPDYTWIDAQWMSDEDFQKYKDAIYYGDRDFNSYAKFMLCAYLGVDEYNKFVKAFNCEK